MFCETRKSKEQSLTHGFVLLFVNRGASTVVSAVRESGSPVLASSARVVDVPPPSTSPVPTLPVLSWSLTTGHMWCQSRATDTSPAVRRL